MLDAFSKVWSWIYMKFLSFKSGVETSQEELYYLHSPTLYIGMYIYRYNYVVTIGTKYMHIRHPYIIDAQ